MSDPIWYQNKGTLKAFVWRIGTYVKTKCPENGFLWDTLEHKEVYKYEICETAYGMRKVLLSGKEDTLPLAKKAVLKHYGEDQ